MSDLIPVSHLVDWFETMADEHWDYDTSVSYGRTDCSGAFYWAYKQEGHNIYHGSNRIARVEVKELIPISEADICPGMAVFKHRKKGLLTGWNLPSDYLEGGRYFNGDLNDYYHIGLVGNDVSLVCNAQDKKNGFVRSAINKGGWSHVGYLIQVDYNSKSATPNIPQISTPASTIASRIFGVVIAPSGKTVKMRSQPSKNCSLYWDVPVNSSVEILSKDKDWSKIKYGNKVGYMMTDYLDDANG